MDDILWHIGAAWAEGVWRDHPALDAQEQTVCGRCHIAWPCPSVLRAFPTLNTIGFFDR